MGRAGILREDERLELIGGEIIEMAAIGSRHAACVGFFLDWLVRHLPMTAAVRVQDPIRLPPGSEPEPDIAVVRRRADFYATAHPGPDDVLLLIEVADTSLTYDRDVKMPLYAAAGIPELWLVDLTQDRVEVFRDPVDGHYRSVKVLARGDILTPTAFPDLAIPCDEIFP
ncbi:MAG: Uma2 family endonuclease [Firmicutes bacterium]|nr:Uma2 family endonuclease [Bacillota bacterium]